jgi:CubicO group peptidase (beta-lactamase class C family)
MPKPQGYFKIIRPVCLVFIALVCLPTACAPTIPSATPIPTLIPATATLAATATPAATATAQDLATALDAVMQSAVKAGNFSGSVLVAQNGHIILGKGYGLADEAKNTPNTAHTKFRLAHVTELFTAMAIMLLQQRGKLNVQDKICQYLTDCPSTWQAVTVHHLLTHTSGIPDTLDVQVHGDPKSPLPLEKMIADAKAQPLTFQPGAQAGFSQMGYVLLGKIIEAASGQTYEAFLQQNIFGPLQMTNTDYDYNRADVAVGYTSPSVMADPVNMWVPFSDSGLDSTVGDLYLWDQALYTDKLVPQKVLDAIFTPYVASDLHPGFSIGYSWLIGSDNGRREIWHPGFLAGFASDFVRYPDDKATIIILSNLWQGDAAVLDLASTLAQKLFTR